MSQSSTPELMRQQNRAIVLATIQEQGPISRVDLANLLGLNPATITRITRDLIEEGLVKEEGEGENKGAGRKPVLLKFNHGARLVIGIEIGSKQITGVIADLASNILARRTALLAPQLTLTQLTSLIDELLDDNPSYRQCLSALCVGGNMSASPLVDGLKQKFAVPILHLENVTLAAAGEAEVGGMQEQRAFILFYLGTKSYSCLYLNGESRVGQLGLSREGLPLAKRLCDNGLVEIFTLLIKQGIPSALAGSETIRARLIFEAARRDDPAAVQAVQMIVDDLAYAALWMANALNITHIVIAGSWLTATDLLLPLLNEHVEAFTDTPPNISAAKLGDESPLIGAVQMAIKTIDKTL
jgi:glucokinase